VPRAQGIIKLGILPRKPTSIMRNNLNLPKNLGLRLKEIVVGSIEEASIEFENCDHQYQFGMISAKNNV